VTTRILTGSTTERTLAVAATRAGLLDPSSVEVLVTSPDEVWTLDPGLGDDDVELVVGVSALRTGRALTRRWRSAPVALLAAGTAAYGPASGPLQGRLAKRAQQVLRLDLVPGLDPLLLAERSVPTHVVPLDAVRAVMAALPGPEPVPDPTTLVLGRSASWTGALDRDEQTDLLVAMVLRCAEAGHSRIALLLDEDAPARTRRALDKVARVARADLTVSADGGPVEAWLALAGIGLVVGSATEDLLVARRVFGRRVAQLDTEVVIKRFEAFDDPRRTAATLVGATVPDLRTWTSTPGGEDVTAVDLAGLMGTVAYAMQPGLLADRRAAAIGFLEVHPELRRRFVRRRRLSELRLPGGKRKVRPTLD
jgi:hypothetical protein